MLSVGHAIPLQLTAPLKLALTARDELRLTVQLVPEVESHPLQLPNVDEPDGEAVKVMLVPDAKSAEHVAPQLMPDGELVIIPLPVPDFEIDNV